MPSRSYLSICLLFTLAACGSDTVTRPPIAMEFDAAVQERVRGFGHAQDGDFGVVVDWTLPSHGGTLVFSTPDGQSPAAVRDVAVRLFMPAHGHDGLYAHVGVRPRAGVVDTFDLDHLYPSMPGDWQLDVRATVDGTPGKAMLSMHFTNETVERFSRTTHDTAHHCH